MYLLAGQHPYLAVLLSRDLNAFLFPVKPLTGSHLLPHNVRLNPLLKNTEEKKEEKRMLAIKFILQEK